MTTFDFAQYLGNQGLLIFVTGVCLIIFPSISMSLSTKSSAQGVKILAIVIGGVMVLVSVIMWSFSLWNYANA